MNPVDTYQKLLTYKPQTTRQRARGWALNLAIVFLAHSEDNPVLRQVSRHTLSTVLRC